MTTTPNEPIAPEPTSPEPTSQPTWGTAPPAPPSGSGTDHGMPSGASLGAGPGRSTPPGARFFDGVRRLGIVRPDEGRWLAGVALGIARRYQVDPVVVRIAFAVLTLFGGLGVALYGLGWLFLPHPDGRIHAQQVLSGTVTAGFVGALLTVLASAHDALPLLVIALVVFLIVRHRRTSHYRTA